MIASYQHSYQHYQLMSVDVKVLGTLMSIFVVFATIC